MIAQRARTPVLAVTLLLGLPAAQASTGTTTASIGATVVAACSVSATTLAFGTYAGVQLDASSIVTVTCTKSTTYNVGLDAGLGGGRRLQQGGSRLNYTLSRDAARSLNWGTSVGVDTQAGTGTGTAQNLTVYGRIAANLLKTPGAYTDTITVTVTY